MERKGRGKLAAETAVTVLCLVLLCLFVSAKEGFHMDELLSFELANAEYNPWIVPTQPEGRLAKFVHNEIDGESIGETLKNLKEEIADLLKNRGSSKLLNYRADVYEEPVWITGEQFRDYITVGRGDAFNYLSVYFNVKDDNHPPLHFMLLHTVSSLFRGKAEAWMGCAVNLAAMAVILILLMRLGAMLAEALGAAELSWQTGLFCALLYGLSTGAAATALLIRMYAMVTMWCVAYFYLVLKKWRDGSFDRKNGGLILVTTLGFWTQYFFLFYCIFLAAAVVILLCAQKKRRQLWGFVRSMATAAVVGLLVFPFAVADVFFSGRGVEALENLSQGLSGYGERMWVFLQILGRRTFSPWLWLLLLVSAVVLAAVRLRGKRRGDGEKTRGKAIYWVLLLVPIAGYFLLAARMSPYLVDRYVMPLFPFVILAGTLLIISLSAGKAGRRWMAVLGLSAVMLQIVGTAQYDGSYLYRGYKAQESVAAEYGENACICVYDGVGYYENLKEFVYYSQTLLLKKEELESRRERESIEALEEFVLLIKGGVADEEVLALFAEQYGFTLQRRIFDGDSVYGDKIYILRKGA